jgi:hypothetical protein
MKEKPDLLVDDRDKFNSFLYVSLTDALAEIEHRKSNSELSSYIGESINSEIPEILRNKKSFVLFRHVATPNHEIARFITITNAIPGYQSIILEYTQDRFLSVNEAKHSLGKLRFQKGINKNGEPIIEASTIVDFHSADNQKLSQVATIHGENLIDFHHRIFFKKFPDFRENIFDLSGWLQQFGGAKQYYKKFLTLFLKDAILLENYMLEKSEKSFTQSVIIPAFDEIESECGFKPLVVALEPTELEGDRFWLSYPYDCKETIYGEDRRKNY